MPDANMPKAPALQVWLSVPKSTTTRNGVTLLRKSDVADSLVFWIRLKVAEIRDVIEVFDVVSLGVGAEEVNIAVRSGVFCEDVVLWNQDHTFWVPDLHMV
jgi:hypothetical protein